MKKVLASNQQVAHYFANSVQPEGRASNFYFESDYAGIVRLFSYGRHFCVARRITADVFAMTTRTYGQSTSKHLAYARSALNGRTVVRCYDPLDSASANKRAAQSAINTELNEAETTRRIQQKTRDGHKARALFIAEEFNNYLAALPAVESADVAPFDVSGLDEMRAAMVAMEQAEIAAKEARKQKAIAEEAEYLAAWRTDPTMRTQGMQNSPIALRLVARADEKSPNMQIIHSVIQTSRGAEIPANDARILWPVILSVKAGERTADDAVRLVRRLGVYNLSTIRADGSIVVACHDIAWPEIERMAVSLELLTSYRVAVRGKHSGRSEILTMRTWPNMDVQREAESLAASYGADVESVSPVIESQEVAA